jgi:hypothetical protein
MTPMTPKVDRRMSLSARKALLRIDRRIKDGWEGSFTVFIRAGRVVQLRWITPDTPRWHKVGD